MNEVAKKALEVIQKRHPHIDEETFALLAEARLNVLKINQSLNDLSMENAKELVRSCLPLTEKMLRELITLMNIK